MAAQPTRAAMRAPQSGRNRALGVALAGVMAGMLGLSFAAVPLYRLFCQVTGYGGIPRIDASASPGAVERTITVRFNADVNGIMPWKFAPAQREVTLRLGEEAVAFYEARNPTKIGRAHV